MRALLTSIPPRCLRRALVRIIPSGNGQPAARSDLAPFDPPSQKGGSDPSAVFAKGPELEKIGDQAEASIRLILESAPEAVVIIDREGDIKRANDLAEKLFGYPLTELVGQQIEVLLPERYRTRHSEQRRRYAAKPHPRPMGNGLELYGRRRDGTTFPAEISLSPIRLAGQLLFVSAIRDVSNERRAQDELRYLAEHDPLTGLKNRRRFQEELGAQVARAHRYGEHGALFVIDVDDFKTINDSHGHGAGDEALCAVADALRGRLRATDVIARIGGDEFAVLLSHVNGESAAKTAADLKSVIASQAITSVDGVRIQATVSIGIAVIDRDTPSDDAALTVADQAMYREKLSRRAE